MIEKFSEAIGLGLIVNGISELVAGSIGVGAGLICLGFLTLSFSVFNAKIIRNKKDKK